VSIRETIFAFLRSNPKFLDDIDTYMEGGRHLVANGIVPEGPDREATAAKYIGQWEDIESDESPDVDPPDASTDDWEEEASPDWAEELFEADHVSHLHDKQSIDNPDTSDVALIQWEEERYYFNLNKYPNTSLSFSEVEELVRAYVYEGSGMTRSTVVRYAARDDFREAVGDEHITNAPELQKGQIKRIFWALDIDKESLPFAPHEYDDADKTASDLAEKWRGQQEAAVEQKYRAQEAKDWKRRYRQEVKKRVQIQSKMDAVADALQENPPHVDVAPSSQDAEPGSTHGAPYQPLLVFADWHIGRVVDLPDNTYNHKVAEQRLASVREGFQNFLQQYRRPIDTIRVVFLGDLVDGPNGTMHTGQQAHQDLYYEEQPQFVAEEITKIFAELLEWEVPLQVYAVPGNHGRGTEDRSDDPTRIVELCTYQVAREMSRQLPGSDRMHWTITRDIVGEFSAYSTQILYTHGDRTPRNMEDTLTALQNKSKDYHLLLQGHRHSREAEESEFLKGLGIQSGSLIGDTGHGRHQLGVGARPSQRIVMVDEAGPKTPGTVTPAP